MTHRIFTLTETAKNNRYDWDTAIIAEEIETIKEFETYEEAITEFEENYNDPDMYGIE